MPRLFIAEKPSLAKAIADGLGKPTKRDGYFEVGSDIVSWCYGHLLEQARPEDYNPEWKKWNVVHLPYTISEWQLRPREDAKAQLAVIKKLLKSKPDMVINAGDPDREGQLLVDEVLIHFGWKGKTGRILLNATDPASVAKALANIDDNSKFRNLYQAALCRQRADWMVGMNLTVAATKILGNGPLISIGRVQTPTLALVVRRDLEIEGHVSRPFYAIAAEVEAGGETVILKHDPQGDDERVFDKATAEALVAGVGGKTFALTVNKIERAELAPLPFILATWQKEAERELKLSAKDALAILQQLYEMKLVSYPRSDCPYLPAEQAGDAKRIATAILKSGHIQDADSDLGDLMAPNPRVYDGSKVVEHHGIIPTGVIPSNLDSQKLAAWRLIARRFLLTLLPDFRFEETRIYFKHDGRAFGIKGEVERNLSKSWRAMAPRKAGVVLPEGIEDGATGKVLSPVSIKEGKTSPPKPYSEASLIADMRAIGKYVDDPVLKSKLKETAGIGTAATQASIIETLKSRGYVVAEGNRLIATAFGRSVIKALPKRLADPGITAAWEQALDQIAAGNAAADDFIKKIDSFVIRRIDEIKAVGRAEIVAPTGQAKK